MNERRRIEQMESELLSWQERQFTLREKYSGTPAGFTDSSAQRHAALALEEARKEYERRKRHTFVTSYEPGEEPFAGRRTYLKRIGEAVERKKGPVILYGIGGIGKTALARAYVRTVQQSGHPFDTVLFLSYNGSMEALICDDNQLSISNLYYSKDKYGSKSGYFREKMKVLRKLAEAVRLLLIIDDCNIEKDRRMGEVFSLPCQIIVTTRVDPQVWQRELCFEAEEDQKPALLTGILVRELETEGEWEEFFQLYQEHSFSEEEKEGLLRYRERVRGHTLFMMFKLRGIDAGESGSLAEKEVEQFAEDLFRRFKLSKKETQILCELSIMPVQGIEEALYFKISKAAENSVERLADLMLVRKAGGWLSLHPIIAEAVKKVFHPGQKTCAVMVERMQKLTFHAWNQTYLENQRLIPYVFALLKTCPTPLYWQFREYDAMITLLWNQGYFEEAQYYCKILLETMEKHYGRNHQVTGEIALRLAAAYYNAMDFEEAHKWYVESYRRLKQSDAFDFRFGYVCCSACIKLEREYRYRGELEMALKLNDESLIYLEQYDDQGRDHVENKRVTYCYCLLYRARILWDMERFEEAWELGSKARNGLLACIEGTKLYDVSEFDRFMIKAMIHRKEFAEAEALAEAMIERAERFRHRLSKETLSAREHLADVWQAAGKKEQAEAVYGELLEILREEFPYQKEWVQRLEEKERLAKTEREC